MPNQLSHNPVQVLCRREDPPPQITRFPSTVLFLKRQPVMKRNMNRYMIERESRIVGAIIPSTGNQHLPTKSTVIIFSEHQGHCPVMRQKASGRHGYQVEKTRKSNIWRLVYWTSPAAAGNGCEASRRSSVPTAPITFSRGRSLIRRNWIRSLSAWCSRPSVISVCCGWFA